MRIIKTETKAYKFDELSNAAQRTALDNYRDINVGYRWWDATYEMIEQAATILGIEIDQESNKPTIYFIGFNRQGDGACFEGYYSYAKGSVKAIKDEFPTATDLHAIAVTLQATQAKEAYKLEATVKHTDNHYYHYNSVTIKVSHIEDEYRDLKDGSKSGITEALRDFCKWIFKSLESEYDYLTSDEVITETIEVNKWEFTEDGVSI
jgi:hypothetical protein